MKTPLPQDAPRVTMAEVARRAGVHQTTVSRVLRNHPSVAAGTRARVRALAAELGYVPDPLIDAFNTHRLAGRPRRTRPTLAWITDAGPASRGTAVALAAARAEATRLGLGLEVLTLDPRQLSPVRLRRIVSARNIDGVVFASLSLRTKEIDFDWPRLCALKIESFHLQPALDAISADHRQAGRLAVERLRRLGYRRIGLVLDGEEDRRRDQLVRAGALFAAAAAGETGMPVLVLEAPGEPDPRRLRSWLGDHRLDAVVSDRLDGWTALRSLRLRRGRRPGFAALDVTGADAGIAGVAIDHARLGAWAVQLCELRRRTHQRGLPARAAVSFVPVTWRDAASAPVAKTLT